MAAPHFAGVAALYKQVYGDAPSPVVEKWIVDHATPGVVAGGGTGGTPNRLLYAGDPDLAHRAHHRPAVHIVGGCKPAGVHERSGPPSGQVASTSWPRCVRACAQPAAMQRVGRPPLPSKPRNARRPGAGPPPGRGPGDVGGGAVVDRCCTPASGADRGGEPRAAARRIDPRPRTRSPNRPLPLSDVQVMLVGGAARRSGGSATRPRPRVAVDLAQERQGQVPLRGGVQRRVWGRRHRRRGASSSSAEAGGTMATKARTTLIRACTRLTPRNPGPYTGHELGATRDLGVREIEGLRTSKCVRHQRLRDAHRPVGLLLLLQDRHQRPPDRHPRAVQRGREPAAAVRRAGADAGAAPER